MLFWISLICLWPIMTIFFPTRVIGRKNVLKGKCIWACNHQSNCDIMVIGTKIFTRIYALGKIELFKNKFLGWYLKKIGCISVHRGQADITAVKQCLRVLKDKQKPLVIFPTGTRSSTPDEVQNLKNGVAMFSLKSDANIVPMVLVRKPKLFRRNRLVIGEPIDISKYADRKNDKSVYEEINKELSGKMEKMIQKYSYKKKQKKQKAVEVKWCLSYCRVVQVLVKIP